MSSNSPAGSQVTFTPAETTVSSVEFWLQGAAIRRPERVAIESGPETITYARLHELAAERSHSLSAELPAGACVALEDPDRFAFAVELHACLLRGHAALPIDPR